MATKERRITLRFETKKDFDDVKRAAASLDRSLNWFIANAALNEAKKYAAKPMPVESESQVVA
jgi:uncharacterized protein (DUF1778 family)